MGDGATRNEGGGLVILLKKSATLDHEDYPLALSLANEGLQEHTDSNLVLPPRKAVDVKRIS